MISGVVQLRSQHKVWFTSDSHFDHGNMLKFMPLTRCFEDVQQMNEAIVQRHNERVKGDDLVFHLGDLSLNADGYKWLGRLNGDIRIIYQPDHHDKRWLAAAVLGVGYLCEPKGNGLLKSAPLKSATGHTVRLFAPGTVLRLDGPEWGYPGRVLNITLNHYAMVEWNGSLHPGNWHLFGHHHGTYAPCDEEGFAMDVGLDCHNLKPVSIHEVIGRGTEWEMILSKKESWTRRGTG